MSAEPQAASPSEPAPEFRFEVTIDNCDREPIHTPGAIQPHGVLVVFEEASGTVLHASSNLGQWFALDGLPARGTSLIALLGERAFFSLQQALVSRAGVSVRHRIVDLAARPEHGQRAAFQAVVHTHRGVCIAELEPTGAPDRQRDWMEPFGETIDALDSATDLEDLTLRMATRIKRLIGFDRVMVYRFDDDWNGHVIADAREPEMESFQDLHYPASDIPAQARELYRSNLVRYIADVDYVPVPVLPWFDSERKQPLDMSHANLRSVSPIHIQYLYNMGVGSTLTVSLLVDGCLWGLIACHHRRPTVLPVRLRLACHALAVTAGYMVGWHDQRERATVVAASDVARTQIVLAFNHVQAPLPEVVEHCGAALLRLAGATGGAFWHGEAVMPFGHWPAGAQGESILSFVHRLLETSTDDIFYTDEVPMPLPPANAPSLVCGVMALSLDAFAASGIVWIRPEYRREVHWGGNPDKAMQLETDASGQPKLSPRSSFARWTTMVKGHSRAWTELDIQAARSLLVLRQVLTVRDSLAQLRLSDRHFRSLVSLQSDAYCQLDPQSRVVALSKPLPTGPGAAEGKTLMTLFAPFCDDSEITALGHAIDNAKPFRGLRLHGHKVAAQDGFVVELGGEAMKDHHGRITGWHGTITDVTHEVAVQTALRQMEAAEMSNFAKSKFLSQMSHELRTPLNAVLGFSQILLMDPAATKQQRGNLLHIQRAGEWLLVMISDLMDLSMVETGNLSVKLQTVDARAVLGETLAMLGSVAEAAAVRLIPPEGTAPVWVRADGSRLKQVLANLTSNALKYNRTHGDVRFTLGPDAVSGTTRIQVHDRGVGMAPAQIQQLFQPFNRLGRENLGIQGTGIGLVIAKQLIEAMGGQISVESEPNRGSIFGVTLADAEEPAANAAGAPGDAPVSAATPDRVVLYVEGEAGNVLLVASIVESLPSVRLVNAATTERGMELTRSLLPAVVLIDVGPVGTRGAELLEAIKADPALRHIRCVAVNADATGRTLKELQVAGFEDRWTLPINLESVWSGLNAALSA